MGWEAGGVDWSRCKQRAGKAPTVGTDGRARAERTANMLYMLMALDVSRLSGWLNADAERNMPAMLVTLDVSRLSGWLNAVASCRVKEGSIGRRGDMRAGRREGVGRR